MSDLEEMEGLLAGLSDLGIGSLMGGGLLGASGGLLGARATLGPTVRATLGPTVRVTIGPSMRATGRRAHL